MSNPFTIDQELRQARQKSAKPMLWISIISMIMFFAGLTSAYILSRQREDWVRFDLPRSFYWSTVVILASSIFLWISGRYLRRDQLGKSRVLLVFTWVLGVVFVLFQYLGFEELQATGLYFTGKGSTVSTSFILGVTWMHVLHLLAGILSLGVVVYKHLLHKYSPSNRLGFELGAIFWHFLDLLWVYLFLFFYFIG